MSSATGTVSEDSTVVEDWEPSQITVYKTEFTGHQQLCTMYTHSVMGVH